MRHVDLGDNTQLSVWQDFVKTDEGTDFQGSQLHFYHHLSNILFTHYKHYFELIPEPSQ